MAMVTLGLIALLHMPFIDVDLWLIGCFGAAAVLLASAPHSPMAQPKSIIAGMLISSAIGLLAGFVFSNQAIAIIMAVGCAMFIMTLLDTRYPPGGAAALIAAAGQYDVWFLLLPIASGTAILVFMQWVSLTLQPPVKS